jgi:hypothetical protein
MMNRVQIGSPAVMKATEAPKLVELDEFLSMPLILKKDLNWKNDVQMYSNYLDRKVIGQLTWPSVNNVNLIFDYFKDELSNEYNQYLHDHPDLKNLLADYLQSVLTHKPSNIPSFSAQFFGSYSAKTANDSLFSSTIIPKNIPTHKPS